MSTRLRSQIALLALIALATLMFGCATQTDPGTTESNASADGLDRTVLPIKEPARQTYKELDARNVKAPARWEVKAPQGAPNVVVVLIDDIGFGASSSFGGPINMPNLEKVAANGLKYNRFHTTALCSPTRMALLTGYNHHSNNAGSIMETSTAFPGNTGVRPQSITPMAEVLRQNGFSTAAFGKYHETPPWEISAAGPYDRWPTHSGFEKFYGFIGGETNQWAPLVYDGTTQVELPEDPNYHFTTDMTNQAVSWMKFQKALELPKSRSLCTLPPGPLMLRTMSRLNGVTSTKANSIRVGTRSERKRLNARRSLVLFRLIPHWGRNQKTSKTGTRFPPKRRNCSLVRWKPMPVLPSIPIMK